MVRTTNPKKSATEKHSLEECSPEELAAGRKRVAERLDGLFADIAPGRSLVDELIAERRAIARAENADYSQRQDDDAD